MRPATTFLVIIFLCIYKPVTSQCDGSPVRLSDPEGAILSPGYPRGYQHNLDCRWQVTLSEGQGIYVFVWEVDLDPAVRSGAPCRDYVMVTDGDAETIVQPLCTLQQALAITTGHHVMTVTFHTDEAGPTNRRGFNITYKAFGCPEIAQQSPFTGVTPDYDDDGNQVTSIKCQNGRNLVMTCQGYSWRPPVETIRKQCLESIKISTTVATLKSTESEPAVTTIEITSTEKSPVSTAQQESRNVSLTGGATATDSLERFTKATKITGANSSSSLRQMSVSLLIVAFSLLHQMDTSL